MTLTLSQLHWLWTRGNRTAKDVIYHDSKMFIEMRKGKNSEFIEIPEDKWIRVRMGRNNHIRTYNKGVR